MKTQQENDMSNGDMGRDCPAPGGVIQDLIDNASSRVDLAHEILGRIRDLRARMVGSHPTDTIVGKAQLATGLAPPTPPVGERAPCPAEPSTTPQALGMRLAQLHDIQTEILNHLTALEAL